MRNSYPYTHVLEYIPVKYTGLSDRQLRDRKAVYSFKDGNCPEYAKEQLAEKIKGIVNGDPASWVVCFIPASTHEKHLRRYGALASYLRQEVGCDVFVDGIGVAYDHQSGHINGKSDNPTEGMTFNEERFQGKKVILVDDVRTRGVTFEKTADRLMELGAGTVFGVFLAQTIHPNLPVNTHPRSFGWEHDLDSDIMDELMAEQYMQDEFIQELYDEEAYEQEQDELMQEIMDDEIAEIESLEDYGLDDLDFM